MEENNLNCWEVKKCGRESSGTNIFLYGVCPVAVESSLDGIHGGKNGGRCCWVVNATHHSEKFGCCCTDAFTECCKCTFYAIVKESTELLVMV